MPSGGITSSPRIRCRARTKGPPGTGPTARATGWRVHLRLIWNCPNNLSAIRIFSAIPTTRIRGQHPIGIFRAPGLTDTTARALAAANTPPSHPRVHPNGCHNNSNNIDSNIDNRNSSSNRSQRRHSLGSGRGHRQPGMGWILKQSILMQMEIWFHECWPNYMNCNTYVTYNFLL